MFTNGIGGIGRPWKTYCRSNIFLGVLGRLFETLSLVSVLGPSLLRLKSGLPILGDVWLAFWAVGVIPGTIQAVHMAESCPGPWKLATQYIRIVWQKH